MFPKQAHRIYLACVILLTFCVSNSIADVESWTYKKTDGKSKTVFKLGVKLFPETNIPALDNGIYTGPLSNQLVITRGMTTSISITNGNDVITDYFKVHAKWTLSTPSPSLLPRTSMIANYGTVSTIYPSYDLNFLPLGPSHGYYFDVRSDLFAFPSSSDGWNFPISNDSFGEKTFTFKIDKSATDADVALFYPADEFQHPVGNGLPGYQYKTNFLGEIIESGIPIPTPNWFYYYCQAYPSPYPISYWDYKGSKTFNDTGHIYIGSYAHGDGDGYGLRPDFEMVNGKLAWVGYYRAYGIDLFARVVAHESEHKYLYTYADSISAANGMNNGIDDYAVNPDHSPADKDADPDNDQIPNGIEYAMGLRIDRRDTLNFEGKHDVNGHEDEYSKGTPGDQEAMARYAENQVGIPPVGPPPSGPPVGPPPVVLPLFSTPPPRMGDWADNGLNYQKRLGVGEKDRILRYDRDQHLK